jgi:glycosyltransferase involved in cell wall biosynthesis
MACGTPVVALDDGAIKEVVGEQALIAKDEDEMVTMVGQVGKFKPGDLRQFVSDKYSQVAAAERYIQLYRRIISGNEW